MASDNPRRKRPRINFRLSVEENHTNTEILKQDKIGDCVISDDKVVDAALESPAKRQKTDNNGMCENASISAGVAVGYITEMMIKRVGDEIEKIENRKKEIERIEKAKREVHVAMIEAAKREQEILERAKKEMDLIDNAKGNIEELDVDIKNDARQRKRKMDDEEGEQNVEVAKTEVEVSTTRIEASKTDDEKERPTGKADDDVLELSEQEIMDLIYDYEPSGQTDDEIIAEIGDIDAFLAD